MTTRLEGPVTRFLPFNQGDNGAAGNPCTLRRVQRQAAEPTREGAVLFMVHLVRAIVDSRAEGNRRSHSPIAGWKPWDPLPPVQYLMRPYDPASRRSGSAR